MNLVDPADDRGIYAIEFANDLATPLGCRMSRTRQRFRCRICRYDSRPRRSGPNLPDLTNAQITQVTSTTAEVDAGITRGSGYGIEVRAHDHGWGPANDRNLLGRFSTQTFSLPRLARTQDYFLRLYDNSSPPRYSRCSAALHVDYPL